MSARSVARGLSGRHGFKNRPCGMGACDVANVSAECFHGFRWCRATEGHDHSPKHIADANFELSRGRRLLNVTVSTPVHFRLPFSVSPPSLMHHNVLYDA